MRSQIPRRPVLGRADARRRHKPDYVLLLMSLLLLIVGLIVVYAISPGLSAQRDVSENYFVTKQLTAIGLGVVAFAITASLSLDRWRKLVRPLVLVAIGATLLSLILPVSPEYPAHRWIRFGGISIQSVELVKLACIAGLAVFLEARMREGTVGNFQRTLKPLLFILGAMGIVIAFLQKDLGSTAVLVAMMGAMVFVAGLPLLRVAQGTALIMIAFVLFVLPFSYRRDRITTFINPERDCQSAGYQACQALIAVGSGGVFGKGLAHSGQAYGYLPEAANDSIFAIIGEKFGFLGSSLLVCLFIALFIRIKNIMERAPDDFSRLMVAGILAWLSIQTFINIGAMLGLFPLKGITLPFVSYGGTSVVFVTAVMGIVFNVSRYTSYNVRNSSDMASQQRSVSRTPTVMRRRSL